MQLSASFLLGTKKIPQYIPDSYGLGDEDEAMIYAFDAKKVWHKENASIDWLKKNIKLTTGVGRNKLCPCGSGKKYKKCCGK